MQRPWQVRSARRKLRFVWRMNYHEDAEMRFRKQWLLTNRKTDRSGTEVRNGVTLDSIVKSSNLGLCEQYTSRFWKPTSAIHGRYLLQSSMESVLARQLPFLEAFTVMSSQALRPVPIYSQTRSPMKVSHLTQQNWQARFGLCRS